MIVSEIVGIGNEEHVAYQTLEISNADRQLQFLKSIVQTSLELDRPFLSQTIIKALNYHAITCLHTNAGEFRPCQVTVGSYNPPQHFRVQALMDDFVNTVNRRFDSIDIFTLAAYVLWRMNWIHPFINGNGRTARATCLYIICLKAGGWLPGKYILPELIKKNRAEYVDALKDADQKYMQAGQIDVTILQNLLRRLIEEQINS